MQRGDWPEFWRRMREMGRVLKGRRLTDDAIRAYWRALADLSLQEVLVAFSKAEKHADWMPTPSEIRAFAGRGRTDNPRPTPKNLPNYDIPSRDDPQWDVNRRRAREMVEALTRKEAKRIADEEDLI